MTLIPLRYYSYLFHILIQLFSLPPVGDQAKCTCSFISLIPLILNIPACFLTLVFLLFLRL